MIFSTGDGPYSSSEFPDHCFFLISVPIFDDSVELIHFSCSSYYSSFLYFTYIFLPFIIWSLFFLYSIHGFRNVFLFDWFFEINLDKIILSWLTVAILEDIGVRVVRFDAELIFETGISWVKIYLKRCFEVNMTSGVNLFRSVDFLYLWTLLWGLLVGGYLRWLWWLWLWLFDIHESCVSYKYSYVNITFKLIIYFVEQMKKNMTLLINNVHIVVYFYKIMIK